jgi:rare lipoprotein A
MKSLLPKYALLLTLLFPQVVLSEPSEPIYHDLQEHHMYYEGILAMTEAGAVSGYADGSFLPMNEVNRVEALKMILEATGQAPSESEKDFELNFPDVEEDAWYLPYVNWSLEKEILTGNDDGTLRPAETINRVEALKILVLATDNKSELPSLANDEWYTAYLHYGIDHALITPDKEGSYTPEAPLTRGELCDLLYRFQNAPYTGTVEYGIASYYGWSFDGRNTASGIPLDADGFMAAHKTLPFGTRIRVTSLKTEQSVIIEVVDRGPYTEGFIVDLTPGAFQILDSLSTGILNVRLEVLSDEG